MTGCLQRHCELATPQKQNLWAQQASCIKIKLVIGSQLGRRQREREGKEPVGLPVCILH